MMKKAALSGLSLIFLLPLMIHSAAIKKPYDFAPGALIKSTDFNSNFNVLYNWANGGIDMENLLLDGRMMWKVSGGQMTVKGSYVGIGLISPEYPLHIAYSIDNKPIQAKFGKGGMELFDSAGKPFVRLSSSSLLMTMYSYLGYGMGFRVSPAGSDDLSLPPQMIILTNGRVGIGTTIPGAMLHVKKGSVGPYYIDSYVSAIIESDFNSYLTLLAPSTLHVGIRFGDQNDTKSAVIAFNNYSKTLIFGIKNNTCITVASNGNVGIGSSAPEAKLVVLGDIKISGDLITDVAKYPDFVFAPGYALMSLPQVAEYIHANGHLPGMPSAEQVKKDGLFLKEQATLTLQKLEEAFLYILQQEDKLSALKKENDTLKVKNAELEKRLSAIEKKIGL